MAPQSRMATLDSPMFKCCHTLKTLGWPDDAYANELLTRAANQVKPIMAKRRWAVPLLSEFYPPAPNLLGLNHAHGAKIELRLRRPNNRDAFLPYESILGTLLHELAHIEVGPHNAGFYKLLDELNAECDALVAAGDDGSGGAFHGAGRRVAPGLPRNVPMHVARERAVLAAQKRHGVAALMPKGGRRLGGEAEVARLCDPREMALAAAVRRRGDEIWCGSAAEGPLDVVALDENGRDDADDDVVFVKETRAQPRAAPQRPARAKSRGGAQRVPVRQNAAALAALQRARQRR